MTCCFFGHNDASSSIYEKFEGVVENVILENGVTSFFVGNQGQFDNMTLSMLRNQKLKYPHINYNVVLTYMPSEKELWNPYEYGETMLPECIESVHPRYAISWRNKWMVDHSEYVICYVTHSWGGAAKYVEMAGKKGKQILYLN